MKECEREMCGAWGKQGAEEKSGAWQTWHEERSEGAEG